MHDRMLENSTEKYAIKSFVYRSWPLFAQVDTASRSGKYRDINPGE